MWFHKRFDFYGMLHGQARCAEKGLALLCQFVETPTRALGVEVQSVEQEADELRRKLIEALHRTFITPFDREDVFGLSRAIDDMVDYADTSVKEMLLLDIEPDEHMKTMAQSLFNGAQEIRLAVEGLRKMRGTAHAHVIKAKKFENHIEHVYREALAELFKNPEIVIILKKREIYRHLSNAADRGDEAANIVSDILIKNG